MSQVLVVEVGGAEPARAELSAPVVAGGSRGDGLHLPGAAPASARLVPCDCGVVVEAAVPGIRVGGRPVPPGGRRLLRRGERAELPTAALRLVEAAAPEPGTRAKAAAVLRGAAGGAAAGAPALLVLTGPAAGARHPLAAEQTVGRGAAATIRVADPRASRVHARISVGLDGVCVEDLSSKNGVLLDGVRVERGPVRVRRGEELRVGDTALALEDGGAPDGRAAAAAAGPRSRGGPALAAALLAACATALALASF